MIFALPHFGPYRPRLVSEFVLWFWMVWVMPKASKILCGLIQTDVGTISRRLFLSSIPQKIMDQFILSQPSNSMNLYMHPGAGPPPHPIQSPCSPLPSLWDGVGLECRFLLSTRVHATPRCGLGLWSGLAGMLLTV